MLKFFPYQKGYNLQNSFLLSILQTIGNFDAQRGTTASKQEARRLLQKEQVFFP